MLLTVKSTGQFPYTYLQRVGNIFAIFDQQDSGNLAYGVTVEGQRYFVKTAGDPADTEPYLDHDGRVALLRNAVRLAAGCNHPTLCRLFNVIESPAGPMLIYEWVEGELVSTPQARREDPASSYQRFRALPANAIIQVLDQVYDLHRELAAADWVAGDLYDGCLIYDFGNKALRIMDLDTYHQGPFTNKMGRMFGSSRFMAPEEFELGATIDQRTTVFTLGRMAANFLGDGTLERERFRGSDALHTVITRACSPDRNLRFADVAAFVDVWAMARARGYTDR